MVYNYFMFTRATRLGNLENNYAAIIGLLSRAEGHAQNNTLLSLSTNCIDTKMH
jgi:hypothetical protein